MPHGDTAPTSREVRAETNPRPPIGDGPLQMAKDAAAVRIIRMPWALPLPRLDVHSRFRTSFLWAHLWEL
jgi:hypothetical protein